MSVWIPVLILPNIELTDPIGDECAAVAPVHDLRVAALRGTHAKFDEFLGRFTGPFGEHVDPTVLLVRSGVADELFRVDALASFRNLIAISAVTYNTSLQLKWPHQNRVLFGDYFALYPWMLDKDYQHLIGRTPAILGLHDVLAFRGQSSPGLPRKRLTGNDLDGPLLRELLLRWRRRHENPEPDWNDIALLRSLNMAYHASLMPALIDATFLDTGRVISLWVSAFEILVHPGGDGKASRDKVFDLIEAVSWETEECKDLSWDTGGERKQLKRTLGSWVYQILHNRRNDFLHGNPVSDDDLVLPISRRNPIHYAAPLYRSALSAFLPLRHKHEMPSASDPDAFAAYILTRMDFERPQRLAEEALLTAVKPPREAPL